MSIFREADVLTVSSHNRGCPATPSDGDDAVAMQLLADGVPLELLVDIAMGGSSPAEAENPGYYWL